MTAGLGPENVANGEKRKMICYEIVLNVKNILAVVAYGKDLNLVGAIYCLQPTLLTQKLSLRLIKIEYSNNIHDINHSQCVNHNLSEHRDITSSLQKNNLSDTQLFPGSQKSNQANDGVQVT